jgi:thymidylate synthase (FAD)
MINTVELIGTYGDDFTIAQSAWTSTSRDLSEERKNRVGGLLSMLAREGHHTPFEKSMLHFYVVCDTASHIHFLKHRVGVSINAESARYKELNDDKFYVPEDWPDHLKAFMKRKANYLYDDYHYLINELEELGYDRKRAKESARFILPYANQLGLDVSFNMRSFMHFQGLRNKPDAQVEIREIADQMLQLVKDTGKFDLTLKAFEY